MAWAFDGGDWARVENGVIQLKSLDGSWATGQRPEHAESLGYVTAAVNDPSVDKLFAYAAAGGQLNTEQAAFVSNPLVGLDSFGQGSRWGAIDLFDSAFSPQQAGALLQFGGSQYLTDADRAAGANFNQEQSPAAQSARSDSGGFGDWLSMAALAVAAYFAGPAVFAAEGSAAASAAALETASLESFYGATIADAGVSASTWAAFGAGSPSTVGLYNGAISSAINTSVAEYAAAAAAGETIGAGSAFSMLPVSSMGAAVTPGFFETALEAVKGVKKAVDTIQLVNKATGQKAIVPKNAPVPAGYKVDASWSPSLGDTVGKFVYDPASGALVLQSTQAAADPTVAVVPAAGAIPPGLALAAAAAAVFFLVKK